MRRQVQARSEGNGTGAAVAQALGLVLLVYALFLASCGASLTSEFAALDAADGKAPHVMQATGEGKPLARAADKITSAATPGSSGYKIGPLDVVEFSVFKVPELKRTAQVAETGTVNLPLVGEIQAAGRTAQEVERELAKTLGAKFLQSPQVTLLIKEYNSQRVTVEGAVKRPGVYPLRGKTSLLQVIATAQGLDRVSDSTVVVFRRINGKRLAARFDVAQIRSGATNDPPIQSGDVVVAPSSAVKGAFDTILKSLPLTTVFALL